jgi:DNA replicative helicase MCM subunit Mcm2 (Cdc46/Mcm family)
MMVEKQDVHEAIKLVEQMEADIQTKIPIDPIK